MKNHDSEKTLPITRRQLLYLASAATLSIVTGCDGHTNQHNIGDSASSALTPIIADGFNAAGSLLTFLGGAASVIPCPAVKPWGVSLNLLGGLCSAIGANETLSQALHTNIPSKLFSPGVGMSQDECALLQQYATKHGWSVVSGINTSQDTTNQLSEVQYRINQACPNLFDTPLFVAESANNGKRFYFQFLDRIHVYKSNTNDLIINDAGTVYVMGHRNKAYRCRIRVLDYLLEDDACSWIVMEDTQEDNPCPVCGCRIFLQRFTNDVPMGGVIYEKSYRFAPKNDPNFDRHRAHSGNDPGCRPDIPCGTRA